MHWLDFHDFDCFCGPSESNILWLATKFPVKTRKKPIWQVDFESWMGHPEILKQWLIVAQQSISACFLGTTTICHFNFNFFRLTWQITAWWHNYITFFWRRLLAVFVYIKIFRDSKSLTTQISFFLVNTRYAIWNPLHLCHNEIHKGHELLCCRWGMYGIFFEWDRRNTIPTCEIQNSNQNKWRKSYSQTFLHDLLSQRPWIFSRNQPISTEVSNTVRAWAIWECIYFNG